MITLTIIALLILFPVTRGILWALLRGIFAVLCVFSIFGRSR